MLQTIAKHVAGGRAACCGQVASRLQALQKHFTARVRVEGIILYPKAYISKQCHLWRVKMGEVAGTAAR